MASSACCTHCAAPNPVNSFQCPDCPANGGATQSFCVCDRECQKGFWKNHKKTHRGAAAVGASAAAAVPGAARQRTPGYDQPPPAAGDPSGDVARFSDAQKRQLAEKVVDSFLQAMQDDFFPAGSIERIFGVSMEAQHPKVKIRHALAEMGLSGVLAGADVVRLGEEGDEDGFQPLGYVVYATWATLFKNGMLRKKEVLRAMAEGRLPEWFEEQVRVVRSDGQPLSYFCSGLVEADVFAQIDWDHEKLGQLRGDWGAGVGVTAVTEEARADDSQFKSHLKLSRTELRELVVDWYRGDLDAEAAVDRMVEALEAAFEKIGRDVAREVDFEGIEGSQIHDYVWKTFGPASTKAKQIWWIQNCGLCGAPDDLIRGEELFLMRDSVEKIVRLLK